MNTGIKQTPIGVKSYYKNNRLIIAEKLKANKEKLNELIEVNNLAYNKVKSYSNIYLNNYGFNIKQYKEFIENKYIDGELLKDAKILVSNDENDSKNRFALIVLLRYANSLTNIHNINKTISINEKIASLSLKEYTSIVNKYYTEVQKELILKGATYHLPYKLGYIFINRFKITSTKRKIIDYAATKKKKQEFIDKGIELYNKEKADYCKENNIPYNGQDYRVFKNEDYAYEFLLCECRINSFQERFEDADYRHASLRGKTNEDLLEMTNNNINEIMNLPVDMKTKLKLVLTVDKSRCLKYIRNDEQKSLGYTKNNRKD